MANTKAKTKVTKSAVPKVPSHPLMVNEKDWNRELVMNHLCDKIATSSLGIGSILKDGYEGKSLPTYSTIMLWLETDGALSDRYARAKEAQADFMVDEILDIADNQVKDPVMVDGLPLQVDGEMVMARTKVAVDHARLRVDSRKWVAAKLKPKKYGEKIQQEITGRDGGPVATTEIPADPVEAAKAYQRMIQGG